MAWPMVHSHKSANKKSLDFRLLVFFNALFIDKTPSKFISVFSFFVVGFVHGSPLDCLSQIAVLCCSGTNLFSLEKYLTVYVLKVNIMLWPYKDPEKTPGNSVAAQ